MSGAKGVEMAGIPTRVSLGRPCSWGLIDLEKARFIATSAPRTPEFGVGRTLSSQGSAIVGRQFTASEVGIVNVHLATQVRLVQEFCASLAVATSSRRRVEQGVSYRNSAWRPPRQ